MSQSSPFVAARQRNGSPNEGEYVVEEGEKLVTWNWSLRSDEEWLTTISVQHGDLKNSDRISGNHWYEVINDGVQWHSFTWRLVSEDRELFKQFFSWCYDLWYGSVWDSTGRRSLKKCWWSMVRCVAGWSQTNCLSSDRYRLNTA